jgi:hypothetical protein
MARSIAVRARLCRRLPNGSRALRGLGLPLALAGVLAGCATPAQLPAAPGEAGYQRPAGWTPVADWQQQLGGYVMRSGGDPAALAQLPVLRSPAAVRPGRIVFTAMNVDAVVPERDGYDVFGLLVDKRSDPSGSWYVFIVGTIERRDYRPTTITDIRTAAMTVRDHRIVWETGPVDPQALARYRSHADAASAVRFPADHDEFRSAPCGAGLCVEEAGSGARWSIDLPPRESAAPPTGRAAPPGAGAGT